MDLHWLTAADHEVAAAMAAVQRSSRPAWVPTRRQVLVHVNQCLLLWYLCVVLFVTGVRVDSYEDGHLTASDVPALLVCAAVLAGWLLGTWGLHRWAARPPSPRSRLAAWRQTLTALANGFEVRPLPRVALRSTLTEEERDLHAYPRFTAAGVEFGGLVSPLRRGRRLRRWRYLAVELPAPLPHLVLDSVANGRRGDAVPASIRRGRRLSLEGDFDDHFDTWAPAGYTRDALYVLTPDVMAALIDGAARMDVEIRDRTVLLSAPDSAGFGRPESWREVGAILSTIVPRVRSSAARYLDERVPGQEVPRMLAEARATALDPGTAWVAPPAIIGPDGRRLDTRSSRGAVTWIIGAIGWGTLLTLLYAVPGIFAFAGFMSVVDGR